MRFKVTEVKGKDLKPGDLFSNVGKLYWSEKNIKQHDEMGAIGQKVYIRTETPLNKEQQEEVVYKIEIEKKAGEH